MIIAIVPARGGSKGLPHKNSKELAGLSLTAWAIRAGLRANNVDQLILSTDDDEIAQIGHEEGASVWMRPKALATDSASTFEVLTHINTQLVQDGEHCDGIVLLEPTSPLRTPSLVDICIEEYRNSRCRTLVTVCKLERHPANILCVRADKQAHPFIEKPKPEFRRRQDFDHLKQVTGAVYVINPTNLVCEKIMIPPIMTVEMDASLSVSIDTILDFHVAEVALQLSRRAGENYACILNNRVKNSI